MRALGKRTGISRAVALAFCAVLLLTLPAAADVEKSVSVALGKADTVDLPGSVVDILVANPAIADVGALRSDRLYIVGRAAGDTNVLAFNASGEVIARVEVHVHVDQKTLKDTLKELFPNEEVEARTVNEDIILTGKASNPGVANQIVDVASRFVANKDQTVVNMMSVKGEQQVMLKVRIVEANRAALRELGVETDYRAGVGGALPDSAFSANTIAGTGLTSDPYSLFSAIVTDTNFGPLEVNLRALERDGLVNTLAEPNLTAISGETAGFLAGGEFPVPTGTDSDGNIIIEFKQFGVSLNFKPIVLNPDRISLQLSTEVSALADQDGITLNSIEIPGLSVRRAQTTVELGSGNTLMIAGLLESKTIKALNGLPGITDVPILGELFKSRSFEQNESELVVMVTPYLVQPFAKGVAERKEDAPQERQQQTRLTEQFIANLRRIYGGRVPASVDGKDASLGYILD